MGVLDGKLPSFCCFVDGRVYLSLALEIYLACGTRIDRIVGLVGLNLLFILFRLFILNFITFVSFVSLLQLYTR